MPKVPGEPTNCPRKVTHGRWEEYSSLACDTEFPLIRGVALGTSLTGSEFRGMPTSRNK